MVLRHVGHTFFRRSDDEAAFERLYEQHVEGVYRYSLAMLGDAADAEDVTQTTFLNAYRAFKKGTRPEKPSSWLIAIAHNVCRQRFRQAQRRPREVAYDEGIGEAATVEHAGPTADELRRALSELPPNQRAALVMRELEGASYAEISGVLGVSVSALETLLFRARRSLREQLEEHISCQEAALAINRQLDGRLSMGERRALRAHLRACSECNSLVQSQRAQRRALKSLALVPLPLTIAHWSGGNSASAATGAGTAGGLAAVGATTGGGAASTVLGAAGVAAKVAAVVAAGVVVGGGTYEGVTHAEGATSGAAVRSVAAPTTHTRAVGRTSKLAARVPVVRRTELAPGAAISPAAKVTRAEDDAASGKKATGPHHAVEPVATSKPHTHRKDALADDVSASDENIAAGGPAGQSQSAAHKKAETQSQSETHTEGATHTATPTRTGAVSHSRSPTHTQAATHTKAATQSQSAANTHSASNPQAAVHAQATTHDKAASQSQSATHTQAPMHSQTPPAGAKSSGAGTKPEPATGSDGTSQKKTNSSTQGDSANTTKGKAGNAPPDTTTTTTATASDTTSTTSSGASQANGRGK